MQEIEEAVISLSVDISSAVKVFNCTLKCISHLNDLSGISKVSSADVNVNRDELDSTFSIIDLNTVCILSLAFLPLSIYSK